MKRFAKWIINAKDYNVLLIGIILFAIGYLIKFSFVMSFAEYKNYIQVDTYFKVLYDIQQIAKLIVKFSSFIIGGFFMGEYLGRKLLRGA